MSYPEPGGRFGELQIERELGAGAFGKVYLAHDPLIDRRIALKVILGAREKGARILREARLVGQLVHPNIVTLHRVHRTGEESPWGFEFEYVEGGTLQALLDKGPLPAERQIEIARGIAEGLGAAHRAGVVHGDVKPGNILLAGDGTPKLADFGLGQFHGDLSLQTSDEDAAAGTPAFMAPEVLMGEAARPPSDVWSLGVVLYLLACGRRPFVGQHLHSLLYAIHNVDPAPPPPETSPYLVAAIHACVGKLPEDRARTATEIASILAGAQEGVPRKPARTGWISHLRGRGREEGVLRERLHRAAGERRGSCTLLTGEPGIGKSALAKQTRGWAQALGFTCLTVKVSAMEGLLRPLLRALHAAAEDQATPLEHGDSTRESLGHLLESSRSPRIDASQPVLATLQQTLSGLLRNAPLALILEDMEEGNADDRRIATHLARRLVSDGAVVLLLAPEEIPDLAAHSFIEPLALARLDREDGYALLEDHAGKGVAPRIARLVHERAAGNPLHMLELFRHLVESDNITLTQGQYVEGARWADLELPRRFRDLVASRLLNLPDEDRDLLELAAVAGSPFDGAHLAAVSERPLLAVLRSLQRIYRERGIVVPLEEGYRFASPILREVIYADVAADLRRLLHRRFAEHLAQDPRVEPECLAAHWEQADDRERAAPLFLAAARGAARRLEKHRAVELARRGGLSPDTLCPENAREHSDLLLATASFHYYDLRRHDHAEQMIRILIEAAREAGDVALEQRAVVRRSEWTYRAIGDKGVDLALLERAGRELPACHEKAMADYLRGIVLKFRGDLDAAEEALRRATRSLDATPHDGLRASVTDQMASLAMRRGRIEEAEMLYARAAELSRRCGRTSDAAASDVNRAIAASRRGALDGITQDLRRAIRSLEMDESINLSLHARLILAQVQASAGDFAAANETTDEAVERLRSRGYWLGLGDGLILQGSLRAVGNRHEEALVAFREAQELGERDGFLQVHCSALAWQAKSLLAMGSSVEATEAAQRCVALAARTNDPAVRHLAAGLVAEAVFLGLAASPSLTELVEGDAQGVSELLARAAAEWRGSGSGNLRAASRRLRATDVADRRAEMRLLAALLDQEALRREGDPQAATEEAMRGKAEAQRIGHLWFEGIFDRE